MAAGLTLTNDQTAPRAAREALSEAMAGLPETTRSDAALLVSELVSNSVVHSPGSAQVEVFVVVEAGIVRVEVSDDSATIARREPASRSKHGFGLGPGRHPGVALGCGAPRWQERHLVRTCCRQARRGTWESPDFMLPRVELAKETNPKHRFHTESSV
jgi:hypothetical protein